jgi:hypothetical protein
MEIDIIVAKKLMEPLDANKPVILTRQIIQSLLSPMADDLKPKIFHNCLLTLLSTETTSHQKERSPT